jgi:hypothetical protein
MCKIETTLELALFGAVTLFFATTLRAPVKVGSIGKMLTV